MGMCGSVSAGAPAEGVGGTEKFIWNVSLWTAAVFTLQPSFRPPNAEPFIVFQWCVSQFQQTYVNLLIWVDQAEAGPSNCTVFSGRSSPQQQDRTPFLKSPRWPPQFRSSVIAAPASDLEAGRFKRDLPWSDCQKLMQCSWQLRAAIFSWCLKVQYVNDSSLWLAHTFKRDFHWWISLQQAGSSHRGWWRSGLHTQTCL